MVYENKKFKYLKHPGISDSGSHEHQDVSLSPSELVSSGPTPSELSGRGEGGSRLTFY